MRPQWFKVSEIPFGSMWPADYRWYPHMLSSKYFDGYIMFEGHDRIMEYRVSMRESKLVELPHTDTTA